MTDVANPVRLVGNTSKATVQNIGKSHNPNNIDDCNNIGSSGNGSRSVSFNRDVHVKRIGSRSEPRTFPTSTPKVRKEPPNLSSKALRKEAELVLAHADRIDRARSRRNSGGDDKFNSLPSRKSRGKATVSRSTSDVSSKKPQKSLLNLFSKSKHDEAGPVKRPIDEKPRITINRSNSDIGQSRQVRRKTPRRNTLELKHDPLTPIIEASPVEYTKNSDPLTAFTQRDHTPDQPTGQESDLFPIRSTSRPVMETIQLLRQNSKSQEGLHCSQLPPEKPSLTKGVTVENIVKRLSSERHTSPPPPQIIRDGFSYTRPGEHPIVYAQVVCSDEGKNKHTIRNEFSTNTSDEDIKKSSPLGFDERMATGKDYLHMKRPTPPLPKYTLDETDNFPRTRFKPYNSDEDEGLGLGDHSKRFSSSYYKTTTTTSTNDFSTNSDEDHITPVVKYAPPERPYVSHSYSTNYRGQADGKEYFPEFHELSQRREILESRIRNRIGSRELLDKVSPERELATGSSNSRYDSYHHTSSLARRSADRLASDSPVRRRTVSPPPPPVREDLIERNNAKNRYVETFVTKTVINRDGKPYTEEYVERFKYPNKNVEDVRMTRTTYDREGSAERTEVQNFTQRLPLDSGHSRQVVDKGDSGIENDFRKDSFNGEFSKRKKYTLTQNILTCESFLRNERTHTNACLRKPRKTYSYRERSIDDGSRFDPRLDEYSADRGHPKELKSSLKQQKKTGGLAKVKQFMSSTKKRLVKMGETEKKDSRHSSIRSDERSRYDEKNHLKVPDIATRRRLSTPKSSPSTTKRSLSFKGAKNGETGKTSRPEWFKSFDRLSRKKSDSKSQLSSDVRPSSGAKQQKSLRFFGDTDSEFVDKPPSRSSRSKSSLSKSDKRYQSAYDLETTPKFQETRYRSSSMENLEDDDRHIDSKRRDQSTSDHSTSYRRRTPSPVYPPNRHYSVGRDYTPDRSTNRKSYSRSRENSVDLVDSDRHERSSRSRTEQHSKKPPSGPQKPARSFQRAGSLNRETDRIHDSSGTEGESSQQSQRSVVFLHATTVGDIPHPQISNARRMAYSRESLNSSKKLQPMTRTVSRSISVLAPWKPKHVSEGYEINYHNDQQQAMKSVATTLPRPLNNRSHSQSTLNRTKQKTRRSHTGSKDDLDSDKSSSFENAKISHGTQRGGGGQQTYSLPRRPREGHTAVHSGGSRTNTLQKHRRN
ncbi:zinc finger CCCH domain-containing protein 13 [Toxorhynchites rutilus septentrionalis]|uniref:zinc finger CCCH domain-containing protein 13 n=1 Tax=Toxorhynchites rutilus septentrionalis TaxID=329112 RepID=UPI00247ABD58|nr:zinc finger CCCH domain-containing protein 13 [Toxorhynchites rutilus septentrionalis]XP_055626237.1 zinc finger CCCH domain-containing protein 13 [Toxorhynchites rutilus septentrionalis]